jgi:hypothetical protein
MDEDELVRALDAAKRLRGVDQSEIAWLMFRSMNGPEDEETEMQLTRLRLQLEEREDEIKNIQGRLFQIECNKIAAHMNEKREECLEFLRAKEQGK